MTQKPCRVFTDEQRAAAVRIVNQSGKPVIQVAREMGLTESALRRWVKQAQIDHQSDPQGKLTSAERKELNELRRDLKRVQIYPHRLDWSFILTEGVNPRESICQW